MASNKVMSKKSGGGSIIFDSALNPFNFEGMTIIDWRKQIESESKAITFTQMRQVTIQEVNDNPLLRAGMIVDVPITLWDCTQTESLTKPGLVQVNFVPNANANVGGRSGSTRSSADVATPASSLLEGSASLEYKLFEDNKKNGMLQETRKREGVDTFVSLIKKTMLPATFAAWQKRFIETHQPPQRSVFSVWNSLSSVRDPKLLEVLDQRLMALHRQEEHIITMSAWVDETKKKWRSFNDLSDGDTTGLGEAAQKLRKMELLYVWSQIQSPSHSFAAEVQLGMEELLKRDSYSALTGVTSVANLESALTALVDCVQRHSTKNQAVHPIATAKSNKAGVPLRSLGFADKTAIEVTLVDDATSNTLLLDTFANYYHHASGEAKATAFFVLKDGKAKPGDNKDMGKYTSRSKLSKPAVNNASNNSESAHAKEGGERRGGGGKGSGKPTTAPNNQQQALVPAVKGALPDTVITEDSYAGITCTTTCQYNPACGKTDCAPCLEKAMSGKPTGNSKKRKFGGGQNKVVVWTPVLNVFNHVTTGKATKPSTSSASCSIDPNDVFSMVLDSGSEQSAVRKSDVHYLNPNSTVMYDVKSRAPFRATSATGHELKILGHASLGEAFRDCFVMGDDLIDNLLSCEEFKHDCYITLVPRSAALDWRAYVFSPDGRVIAVADDDLRVYPTYNDAMIVGIPNIVPPVIANRNMAEFGPSGEEFWLTAEKQRTALLRKLALGRDVGPLN